MLLQLPVANEFLGPWGQLGLLLIALLFAFLTWRNRNWQSVAAAAQAANVVLKDEMEVHKEKAERLGVENRELIAESASLKARTDLQPLVEAFKSWTEESRSHFLNAMQRLEQIHGEQTIAMAAVTETLQMLTSRLREGSLTVGGK